MGPSGNQGSRHGAHRHGHKPTLRSSAPFYALALLALLMIGLGGVMVWKGVEYFRHAYSQGTVTEKSSRAAKALSEPRISHWQRDVLSDFQQAAEQVKSGHIMGAEMHVDQATAEMEEARVRSKPVAAVFFGRASSALNGILNAESIPQQSPGTAEQDAGTDRVFQHVTEARIELAELRSLQEPAPPDSMLEADTQTSAGALPAAWNQSSENTPASASAAPPSQTVSAGHVLVNAPREIGANQVLNPASFGGRFLDASLMPDTAEILLPPETRRLSDNVHVQNLTIAGASQTLDGIHWHNVTFIGTRLRYEDGQLDLQNVRFVRCTFGFPSDARSASIVNAIIDGKTSLTIQ